MDYSIDKKPTEISYNLDTALPYGEMPNEALISKFEETAYMNDSEDLYENYARDLLKDRSPDTATLAQDLPRRNYNSKGFLNLLHSGGRGEENTPAHPEMFMELTEREPRGVATDPDFRKMADQQNARMRFVRWSADADNSVHEGRWSEKESYHKARYLVQKAVQPRAKIFTTAKDGRREGMRRDYYPHKSYVNKVEEDLTKFRPNSQTFTDYITDFALNPQRRTTKLSNKLITKTRLYHRFTTDHDFKVAKYGESRRSQKLTGSGQKYSRNDFIENEEANYAPLGDEYAVDSKGKQYKAVGLLLGAIVKQRQNSCADATGGTTETGSGLGQQARKTAALTRDLGVILHEMRGEADLAASDSTQERKTPKKQMAEHLSISQETNHLKPAHHLLNAEIMYKSVQPGADREALKYEIITDDTLPETALPRVEQETKFGKSARKSAKTGGRDSIMEVDGKSLAPQSYKSGRKKVRGPGVDIHGGEAFGHNAKNTQNRKVNHGNYRITGKNDVDPDTSRQFMDNTMKDRHLGPLGKDKYGARRYTTAEHASNDISAIS